MYKLIFMVFKATGMIGHEYFWIKWEHVADLLATCCRAGVLLGLFFGPEEGGDMFL
jgi:hypothetical protein